MIIPKEGVGLATSQKIALDVHAHLVPIVLDRLLAMEGANWKDDRELLEVDGHLVGIPDLYKPHALIAWMDQNDIEKAWISIPPPLYRQQLNAASARKWADYLNDGLVTICTDHPDRLAPLFHLPIEHPSVAIAIATDRRSRGARGFAMAAGGSATPVYSDPVLDPLWNELSASNCFVFIHPGSCCDGRLKAFYLENLVGNPYETAVAAAHLVFGGVCERFPRVKFCLAHAGGATAMIAGRLQHGFGTGRVGIDISKESPEKILKRFHVDCIVHDNAALHYVANTFGEDRVLFGSDWPFPMGVLAPHRHLASLENALQHKLFWENPYALREEYRAQNISAENSLQTISPKMSD